MFKGILATNSGKFPTKVNHVRVPAYEVWRDMARRCWYTKERGRVEYASVKVSDDWLDYSNFYEDVVEMIGYNCDNFALDKDILSGDEKIYSKDTCCFVPRDINVALTKSKAARGNFAIGVDFHKKTGKFRARHRGYIGLFDSETEAFYAYKEDKEKYLKYLAEKHREQIDFRVYNALMNYEVKITD